MLVMTRLNCLRKGVCVVFCVRDTTHGSITSERIMSCVVAADKTTGSECWFPEYSLAYQRYRPCKYRKQHDTAPNLSRPRGTREVSKRNPQAATQDRGDADVLVTCVHVWPVCPCGIRDMRSNFLQSIPRDWIADSSVLQSL